jgi:polyhydroxyalkanoate synthesis regulator phasin
VARGKVINTPEDVRRIAKEVITEIFKDKSQVENAAKVNQLLQTWLKGLEVEYTLNKISDIEKRLRELEAEKGKK